MQQLSGINVLVYYFPHTLTTDIGMDYETSLQVGAGLADTYWGNVLLQLTFKRQHNAESQI